MQTTEGRHPHVVLPHWVYHHQLFFIHSVVSDSLWPHGLQHVRLSCPSLSPGVCSNSCPLSLCCHPFHLLLPPSLPALNLSQHQGLFQWDNSPSIVGINGFDWRESWQEHINKCVSTLIPEPKAKQNNVFLISIFFVFRLLLSFSAYLLSPISWWGRQDNSTVLLMTDLLFCLYFIPFFPSTWPSLVSSWRML